MSSQRLTSGDLYQGQDFHRAVGELADQVVPQHNYRLDAKAVQSHHYGEVACRDLRESILTVLPHRCTLGPTLVSVI